MVRRQPQPDEVNRGHEKVRRGHARIPKASSPYVAGLPSALSAFPYRGRMLRLTLSENRSAPYQSSV